MRFQTTITTWNLSGDEDMTSEILTFEALSWNTAELWTIRQRAQFCNHQTRRGGQVGGILQLDPPMSRGGKQRVLTRSGDLI